MPWLSPEPVKGASIAAVCEPSAPSANSFSEPTRNHSSPSPLNTPAPSAASSAAWAMCCTTRRRSRRVARQAGCDQSCRIHPQEMPVLAVKRDRPVADDGVEVGAGRPAPLGPFVLVPAAAHNPAPQLHLLGAPGHALHALGQR